MKKLLLLFPLLALCFAFAPEKPARLKLPADYVFIPSGLLQTDQGERSLQSFYIGKTELSNRAYQDFLDALKSDNRTEDYEKARVRPEGWHQAMTYSSSMETYYHQHPAYAHYPVVNITREGAELYCQWLSDQIQAQNPDWNIRVRLPLEMEWQYAALGGESGKPYPLGDALTDAKGRYLYQFNTASEGLAAGVEKQPVAGDQVPYGPAVCKSYRPNGYGLYNLSGNVAEMLAESGRTKGGSYHSSAQHIRIDGADEYAGFSGSSPFIGFRPVITALPRQ